ncbi:MAG: hypothetical protein VW551_07180 [Euryarchaeota archaeon]|jgi:hypothetical protein
MTRPSFYKTAVMFVVDSWRSVMDIRYNPLKYIPDPSLQAYLYMVLFTMWSVYFGFVASYYLGWLGYDIVISIFVHFGVLVPILITNGVFIDAEKNKAQWLQDWRQEQKDWKFWRKIMASNYERRIKWDIDKEA